MFYLLRPLLCVLVLCWAVPLAATPPDHWRSSAYAYHARHDSVQKILQDFADSFGVRLEASPGIAGDSEGWIRTDSAIEFLDRLAIKYKLQWFVYNKTLYVSPISDNVIKRLNIEQEGASDLKRALQGVGLLEAKFGWGEIADEGAILVSGPERYVDLVQSLMKVKKSKKKTKEEIMVFPLQHASVEDREIMIREDRIVIPGVASVLRNLLEEKRRSDDVKKSAEHLETLQQMESSAQERLSHNPWQSSGGTANGSTVRSGKGVRVEADVRTNAILIHDSSSRQGYYEALIKRLDVAQKLIEIEAVIVDIDKGKLKDLGVDWQVLSRGRRIASNISGRGQDPVNQFANGSATMLISDIERFYASLRLLESNGEASVIANPSVLTLENQPAVIDLSETVYIETVGERVANVVPVTAGTMLRVTPRQISESAGTRIQLVVDIEDGRILQESPSENPRVQRNKIATKAVIDRDYSLVVGGYHIQERKNSVRKLPLIGDIPVLGQVFRSETEDYSQRERLFILTPHISDYRHEPADYSDGSNARVVQKAVAKVQQKHTRSSQNLMERIQLLFDYLAKEQLPMGYDVEQGTATTQCRQKQVNYDFSNQRIVTGPGLEVEVGIVTNQSNDLLQIDESACNGPGVLAVSVWPSGPLKPGAKAEIFIAREPANKVVSRLPSLLN